MAKQLIDDAVGNVLGEREVFTYTDDAGTVYNVTQDAGNGDAVGNERSSVANRPVLRTSQARPIKPRYVLLRDTATQNKSKKVVIGSRTNPIFTGTDATVTINGTEYQVVTRVGERQSRPIVTGGGEITP